MNNTAELVRLKEEQLRLSQSKREHENKLSAILALIRKEGRMTREKYQQCCDAQIRHKQGIKRVDEMISSIKIKIFELSRLENQNKQSMERRLVDLERENAALRAERVLVSVYTGKFTTISGRAMICPDCGRALLHEDRAVIDAARKEAQP